MEGLYTFNNRPENWEIKVTVHVFLTLVLLLFPLVCTAYPKAISSWLSATFFSSCPGSYGRPQQLSQTGRLQCISLGICREQLLWHPGAFTSTKGIAVCQSCRDRKDTIFCFSQWGQQVLPSVRFAHSINLCILACILLEQSGFKKRCQKLG